MKMDFNNIRYSSNLKWLKSAALVMSCIGTGNAQPQNTIPLSGEAKDRVLIKELVDEYAHNADRRKAEMQAALFTVDGEIEVFEGEPATHKPTALIRGHKDLIAGFETLKKYDVTMQFNGQTIIQLRGDSASGETYCLAPPYLGRERATYADGDGNKVL
jgi:SnoaL-like domain